MWTRPHWAGLNCITRFETLPSNSGSVENLNVSAFHGFTPYRFHAAATVTWLVPSRSAVAVYREFGHQNDPGLVFFLGGGFLEVSGRSTHAPGNGLALWIQVRDVEAERRRLLAAGVSVVRGPQQEPWGLVEMWIEDPDGVRIVLVEVPHNHPLRRDKR
jgi:catechol 2,3-dioxygenase-like lactoylglutathione lyase family enzyme